MTSHALPSTFYPIHTFFVRVTLYLARDLLEGDSFQNDPSLGLLLGTISWPPLPLVGPFLLVCGPSFCLSQRGSSSWPLSRPSRHELYTSHWILSMPGIFPTDSQKSSSSSLEGGKRGAPLPSPTLTMYSPASLHLILLIVFHVGDYLRILFNKNWFHNPLACTTQMVSIFRVLPKHQKSNFTSCDTRNYEFRVPREHNSKGIWGQPTFPTPEVKYQVPAFLEPFQRANE